MSLTIRKFVFSLSMFCGIALSFNSLAAGQKLTAEFSYSNAEFSMMMLDQFFVDLQGAPGSHGYVIVYGPQTPKKGEIEAHIGQMPAYFQMRRFPAEKITLINGGYRDHKRVTLAFWIAEPGENAPQPSDTLDIKKVKFQRGKFRGKSLYLCC